MSSRRATYTFRNELDVPLRADVYVPDGDGRSRGAVLWLHGGALIMGGRQDVREDLLAIAERLRITLISPDYRLAPQATLPDIVDDVQAAFGWIRDEGATQFDIDPDRVVVAGESAGGYLSLLMATMDPRPCAVIAYYGYGTLDSPWYLTPSLEYQSMLPMVDQGEAFASVGDRVVTDGHARPDAWKYYLYSRQQGSWPELAAGFDPVGQRADLRHYSPAYHITNDYPPTLLLHGTIDHDVPHAESVAFSSLLALYGIAHEFISLEGFDHGLDPGDDPARKAAMAVAHERVADFVARAVTP